jgi:outer membrane lipoprotein
MPFDGPGRLPPLAYLKSFIGCAVLIGSLAGCATDRTIPSSLAKQVDHSVTFPDLQASPDSYKGRLIVLGGEVLSAKRLKNGTQLEVLQLPLDGENMPVHDRTASQGRFLALQSPFLDPATVKPGTRVTIVGDVTGAATGPLDEIEYTYPTVEIKHLKVWERPMYAHRVYPRGYLGYGQGWWGPYGCCPYYWW